MEQFLMILTVICVIVVPLTLIGIDINTRKKLAKDDEIIKRLDLIINELQSKKEKDTD